MARYRRQAVAAAPPGLLRSPRLSPDGKRLALSANGELAVYDLGRGSLTKMPSVLPGATNPIWMPDGAHLICSAGGRVWWFRADGAAPPQVLYDGKGQPWAGSVTPDGRRLVFSEATATASGRGIFTVALDLADAEHPKAAAREQLVSSNAADIDPMFSPDGKWLAYASGTAGTYHVFVRPYAQAAGSQVQVSTAPGRNPVWSRAAREIFYATAEGRIMVVPCSVNGSAFEAGKPRLWSPAQVIAGPMDATFDLTPDGKRFVAVVRGEDSRGKDNVHLVSLLNFFDFLKQRVL